MKIYKFDIYSFKTWWTLKLQTLGVVYISKNELSVRFALGTVPHFFTR